MNIRNTKIIAITGIMLFMISSCFKDETADQKAEEMSLLKDYVKTNNITETPTASGLYYIETLTGSGESAMANTWMEIKYTGRLLTTNDIVMTNDMQLAKDNSLYVASNFYGPTRLKLGKISYSGLNEGILKMKEGGKARMILPSKLAQGGAAAANIPAYSTIIFDIELVSVIPDMRSFEDTLLVAYLNANEISTDSTSTGVYMKTTTEGTGNFPATGNTVSVSYTGKFLNGRIFDSSSKTFSFTIGTDATIKGFEEGVKLMKKGGSATIVIPFYNAYGEFGLLNNYDRTILIPPFSTLVFDLSLTNISK
jgi:peptidylprolyl isomerase